jgi:hypothetical protein
MRKGRSSERRHNGFPFTAGSLPYVANQADGLIVTDSLWPDPEAATAYPGRTEWRDVPTVGVDLVMGHASGGGLLKVILGETAYDPSPGATVPLIRPVLTIAGTAGVFETLGRAMIKMAEDQRELEE